MADFLTLVIPLTGLASACCGIILSLRAIKSTGPAEALKKWQREADAKLDNDNRRLRSLERETEERKELDCIMLRSMKGVLEHLAMGNHTETMRNLMRDIDDYLITK